VSGTLMSVEHGDSRRLEEECRSSGSKLSNSQPTAYEAATKLTLGELLRRAWFRKRMLIKNKNAVPI
jgi:hypothetical protein